MAVQFVLGPSGTGKTRHCVDAIATELLEGERGENLIYLLPEQATYEAERTILKNDAISGYHRLYVLSFNRLAYLLLGRKTNLSGLSAIGQQMLIHRILRDNAKRLTVLKSSAARPGLAREMAAKVSELQRYAKNPEQVEQLVGNLKQEKHNRSTAQKFADINLVFREYLDFIQGKFIDEDAQLNRARKMVGSAEFLKNSKIWVDGFAGFTTAELEMLEELFKTAGKVQITLCLEPSEFNIEHVRADKIQPANLFYPTQRTYAQLLEIIRKNKLQLTDPLILKQQLRYQAASLEHIEKNIFNRRAPQIHCEGALRLIAAPSLRSEASWTAREICRLIRVEKLRYRDIAVITPDLDAYEHYIKAAFNDYNIPFFLDKRKKLSHHPAVQLICSAAKAATTDFSGSEIFSYLKSDLVPVNSADIDLLENYCVAFGITGQDWLETGEWHFVDRQQEQFDEKRINEIRKRVIKPLLRLREGLLCRAPAERITAQSFIRVLFELLDELHIRETLNCWIEESLSDCNFQQADEHRQLFDKMVGFFDELDELFGASKMPARDFVALLEASLPQLTMAFIPPSLDEVLVGSIERSRHPELKAVFLMGTTQKLFPAPLSFDRLLTDSDTEEAEKLGFRMASTTSTKLCERQYLAYIAFTRACKYLYISYPLADSGQRPVTRSQFVDNIEQIFTDLIEEKATGETHKLDNIYSATALCDALCSKPAAGLQNHNLEKLIADLKTDKQLAPLASLVTDAINYNNTARLDKKVIDRLFGTQLKSSATRLSTFAGCPYRHFADCILELKERLQFRYKPLDAGVFYHEVLDMFFRELSKQNIDITDTGDDELIGVLREQIKKLLSGNSFISNFTSHSRHNAFIIDSAAEILEEAVTDIAKMVRAGNFRPQSSELSFGSGEESIGDFTVDLSGNRKLCVNGKIDRLDIANLQGRRASIIVDYKRTSRRPDWTKIFNGLDLQLQIYMLALQTIFRTNKENNKIVGAFFIPVEAGPSGSKFTEAKSKAGKFVRKARGIFNGEFWRILQKTKAGNWSSFYNFYVTKDGNPYGHANISDALYPRDFDGLINYGKNQLRNLGEQILSGKIEITPYRISSETACRYCQYKPLCRFDWLINHYNSLARYTKAEALEGIRHTDE